MMNNNHDFIASAQKTITTELDAIESLKNRIDDNFAKACQLILKCKGRLVVTGMGKSGHIAHKIAATLASTGTPAFFVHPGEANHGDLGMITKDDVVLSISNSGLTSEVLSLLPLLREYKIPLISMTGNPSSPLAEAGQPHLDISVEKEACPLDLAPTASTTAALVMGDALAVALLEARGFTKNEFGMLHPGGNLGRRLLLKIDELMHTENNIPIIPPSATISEAIVEMTRKRLGCTLVVEDKQLQGLFTDGDVRRALSKEFDIKKTMISDVMSTSCKTITKGTLAAEALQLMEQHKITALPVVTREEPNNPIGIIHMHDLLNAKII